MSEFLSQDEVDSLLRGVTGETDDDSGDAAPAEGVRPYNLASQERIVRGRMPTMEVINERFARLFRIGFFNLIQAKPLRGNGLFIFDPNLVFLVVDNMFGGDGRFHTRVEGREFTQTEQRIIQNLLVVVFETYSKSWEAVHPLEFEFVRSEMNPQFANIATPNEVVIVTTFDIELGGNGGSFHVCMPYSMLEPVKDLLYSTMQGEHLAMDHRWLQLLSKQVQSAQIELVATLGQAEIHMEQVLKMREGDIIPIEVNDNIIATVDGVPVLECKYGSFNNQYALKVVRMLSANEGEGNG